MPTSRSSKPSVMARGHGLRQLWGDQFAVKVQAVDAFLDSTADRVPYIAAVLANPRTRYFLADRRVVSALSQMIAGRASQILGATN